MSLEHLKKYCVGDNQVKTLQAVIDNGSNRKAAEKLGKNR